MFSGQTEFRSGRVLNLTILNPNLELIFDIFTGAGLAEVKVEYYGGGDSGDIETVSTSPDFGKDLIKQYKVYQHTLAHTFDYKNLLSRGGMYSYTLSSELKLMPMMDALYEIWLTALDLLHCGWEINEGSYGDLIFDVPQRQCRLVHNQNYLETDTTETEINY